MGNRVSSALSCDAPAIDVTWIANLPGTGSAHLVAKIVLTTAVIRHVALLVCRVFNSTAELEELSREMVVRVVLCCGLMAATRV